MKISYEYLKGNKMKHNGLQIPEPIFKSGDRCWYINSKDKEMVEMLICKPIDYDAENLCWKYQTISDLTNDYCFIKEHQLTLKPNE